MLLDGKNAAIYGAGGSIGGAVARAFAREGARVYLAGRTRDSLEMVASQIRSSGGAAETARVDALDEKAVDEHAGTVAAAAGSLDISVNLISHGDVQGTPLAEMSLDDFERAGHHRRANDVPDVEGGGAPHDQAAIGGDPHVRRLRGSGASRQLAPCQEILR